MFWKLFSTINYRTVVVCILVGILVESCVQNVEQPPAARPAGLPEYTLAGSWKLSKKSSNNQVSTGDKLLDEAMNNSAAQSGRMLSFFEDGSFTQVELGQPYIYGQWEQAPNNLTLNYNNKKYKVPYKLTTYKSLPDLTLTAKDGKYLYTKYAVPMAAEDEDPYHPANNQWRNKALKSESEAAIKSRLENYLQHIAYILRAAKEREFTVVSFEQSMGPVQIYNGGIGAIPFDDIAEEWKNIFYNEEEARRASKMFETVLLSTRYRGGNTGNWVENDYNLLIAIYSNLKKKQ